jgi:hypothetical protein
MSLIIHITVISLQYIESILLSVNQQTQVSAMTGTACELCDYDEKVTGNINEFYQFSLSLFEMINNDQSLVAGSRDYESILNSNSSTSSGPVIKVGGINGSEGLCNTI